MSENGNGNGTAGIKARMIEITPALAVKMLARNKHNRPVNNRRVAQYAADLRNGDWQFNGEAIKTSVDNGILDGQHRLLAVIEADRPMKALLITGLPVESQETMDQGRARTFSDVLKLRGEQEYTNLAAAVRMVCLYERSGVPFASGQRQASVKELARTLERNPEIRDSVTLAARLRRSWMTVSAVAAMHYLFSVASAEDATDFFTKLATGENLTTIDPVYVLRERLIKEHYDAGGVHARVKLAFVVRAWNAYRHGEIISRLVWSSGGANPERFPQIDGLADAHGKDEPVLA